jgi:hypothetical protein
MSDDNNTVLIGADATHTNVYHTRTTCPNKPQNPREITRESADLRNYRKCSVCQRNSHVYKRTGPSLAAELEDMDPEEL